MIYKKSTLILLLAIFLQGCATKNNNSCSTTKIITPLVVAVQMHINLITKQDVIVKPEC